MRTLDELSVQLYGDDTLDIQLTSDDVLGVNLISDLSYIIKTNWGQIVGDIENQTDLIELVKPEFDLLGIPFNSNDIMDAQNPSYYKVTSLEYIDPTNLTVSHYYSAEEVIDIINKRTAYFRFYHLFGFSEFYNFEHYVDIDIIIGKEFTGTATKNLNAVFTYVSENRFEDILTHHKALMFLTNAEAQYLNEARVTITEVTTFNRFDNFILDCGTCNTNIF